MDITSVDLTGIGIGPFNLGLAALLSRHSEVTGVFSRAQTRVSLA